MEFSWWRRWPDQYDWEWNEFLRFGAEVAEASASDGLLIWNVKWQAGEGTQINLRVEFSPHHPSCRPRIYSADLQTTQMRHVDPSSGGLCLLIDADDQWLPHESVAQLIHQQLPSLLAANSNRADGKLAEAASHEEHVPDPLAAYYDHICEPISAAFFDGDNAPVPIKSNMGVTRLRVRTRGGPSSTRPVELYMDKVIDSSKRRLSTLSKKWKPAGQTQEIEGLWVRLQMPRWASVEQIFDFASAELDKLSTLHPKMLAKIEEVRQQDFFVTSILFEDELKYEANGRGDSWFFIVSRRLPNKTVKHSLVRAHRLSDDIVSRVPVANELRAMRVVVLGTGAIGSFVATDLARSGLGEIKLVDIDVLEPGNSVRWLLGQAYWGILKVRALGEFLSVNFGRTKITAEPRKIGYPETYAGKGLTANPYQRDYEMVRDADLVIDTTASTEVQLAISNMCRIAETHCIVAYATEGAVGGVIFHQPKTSDGCYVCLREHWEAQTLAQPPADPNSSILPVGCNAPTFSGASFDLQEVSLSVTRLAVQVLRSAHAENWKPTLSVLKFEDAISSSFPKWTQSEVTRKCKNCRAAIT